MMLSVKYASGRKGYTLIELIVTLGIMTLFSSILISFNHTSRQQIALYTEKTSLAQTIFRAKSLSLGFYVGSAASNYCGYGIHIDYLGNSYSVFKYRKGNISDCRSIVAINPDAEEIVSTSIVNSGVFVIKPDAGYWLEDVLFVPPEPTVLIGSGGMVVGNNSASVILRTVDGSLSDSIGINSAGLINL